MPSYQLERDGFILGNHVLDSQVVTIGRARDNTIAIANPAVSRYHARIQSGADGYVLTDLGSLNGTYVNGERVKHVLLSENDRIEIGGFAIVFSEADVMPVVSRTNEFRPESQDAHAEGKDTREMRKTSVIAGSDYGTDRHIEVLREPLESVVHPVDADDTTVVLALRGAVDEASTKVLIDIFDEIVDSKPYNIVVDLSEVTSICSTGWGTLLGQQSRLAEMDRGMKLSGLHEGLYGRFRALPFSGLFSCYPTVDEAVSALLKDAAAPAPPLRQEDSEVLSPLLSSSGEPQTVRIHTVFTDHTSHHARHHAETGPSKTSMSLEDKIRSIISERPFLSEQDIRKRLLDDEYGRTDIGRLKLKGMLKKIGLHTRLRRYQFFLKA
jgi:anti-anti-sigma factor